ncbi:UVR domain [Phytophthora cinnamomi]|uniref:UVR domain n=1 Tax=Phytophthora cinnamomi TaxID=4785 RepID=UPI003559E7A9|nr:UVR domain [Phytophthora cinnamomi]
MFGRFFKNKEDGKSGPPGHRQAGQNDEPPAGGGFFNLPPPVSKPYGGSTAPSNPVGGVGGPTAGGYPPYGSSSVQDSVGGGVDMFGGMSVRAPPAASSGNNGAGRYQPQQPQQQYGGYGGAPPAAMPPPQTSGSLFSGLDVAPSAPAPMPPATQDEGVGAYGAEQRKATRSTGSFNYRDVAASAGADTLNSSQYSRTSSSGTVTSRASSKAVKKKKKKTFRPGFGRQLSDESAAALQRGDLKEDDVIQLQQREGRLSSDRSDSSRSSRSVTGPTDLAHLLPPVKSGSVLQGLTVHKGTTPSGGSVLAGLTVHTSASPSPSPAKVSIARDSGSGGNGVLSGLTIRKTTSSTAGDDASEAGNDAPVEDPPAPEVYQKPSRPAPVAPSTPEERLFNTLRDFHESAVGFRQLTVKQNEEENRLLERKAQLANQLTQYEMDLRDVESQQHHACEVEDFEKADALNATINSVRHCITLTESDVRKVDSELVAFVKAKEKAFANQLKSTRGTLRELEKFREDQESERTVVRNEYKLYESNQTEQLQFEAERIDTEMHHVSVSLENVVAEKSEIEVTIEGQCSSEFAVQAQLLEEKHAVEEEVRELERKLKEKLERVQEIQSSIDKAQRDIDTVRNRYSRQLKRIADREEGIKKTKAEVESDGEHLEQQRHEFQDRLKQYADDISIIGKRIGAVKKEMRAASLLANVLEVQETRREQSLIRKKQQTAELSSLNDAAAVAEQSFTMLSNQHEELEKSLSIHRNAIASAGAMIPRLEQEKKASAAQRNFKEAARISKDIKALEKDRSTAEEMVEVVEMELQDLKERIDKREVEYEEKKKELKEMEKHLELATLQELWKEAKHLRTALRKIEKCKSEGDAANDGIDFRTSAMLLVQAEYDACVLQVETLEKKYDVSDPAKDEEVDDDDDDDESIDGEDDEGSEHVSVSRSSVAGKATDIEGSDIDVETIEDSSSALEEIAAQLLELEAQIDKATENEEYELAARLDEKIETLKERQQAIEASISQDASDDVHDNGSLEDAAEDSNSRENFAEEEVDEVEYALEEMVSPVGAVRSHGELKQSLETIQLRVVMLEKQIELATENEDYDTAAAYDEELQSLREEEKSIQAQLGAGNANTAVASSSMFGGLNIQTADSRSAKESEGHKSPKEEVVEQSASGSLFGGLQMSGGPAAASESSVPATEPDVEVEEPEEATASAKVEVASPTSSDMKDSFFGTPGVPNNNASSVAPSASGSLFGGLQMSGNFQGSTSSFSSPEKAADEEERDVAATEGASANAPADGGSMFKGLELSSSAVDVTAAASSESDSVPTEAPVDMFGGLQLSSSAIGETATPTEPVSAEAPSDMFGGLQLSSSAVVATSDESASVPSAVSSDMFGGLQLSSSAVGAVSAEGETEVASTLEETEASEKSGGDSRMSIQELSEHGETGSSNEASLHSEAHSTTIVSETTSTETTVETTSTTVSSTTVTKISDDDEAETKADQDAAQP